MQVIEARAVMQSRVGPIASLAVIARFGHSDPADSTMFAAAAPVRAIMGAG